jgi:nucleotide-binding universal stress UspA family protein
VEKLEREEDIMSTTVKRDRLAPQTEYLDDESILSPIAKTTNKKVIVLLCLDGPWMAKVALSYIKNYIGRLASDVKIGIYLLQIITETKYYRVGDGTVTTVPCTEEDIKQTMNETVSDLNKAAESLRSKNVTITVKVGIGTEVSKEIIQIAEEVNANLIVMFTHSTSWLSRLTFSSMTDKVLRKAESIPIMVVRADNLKG